MKNPKRHTLLHIPDVFLKDVNKYLSGTMDWDEVFNNAYKEKHQFYFTGMSYKFREDIFSEVMGEAWLRMQDLKTKCNEVTMSYLYQMFDWVQTDLMKIDMRASFVNNSCSHGSSKNIARFDCIDDYLYICDDNLNNRDDSVLYFAPTFFQKKNWESTLAVLTAVLLRGERDAIDVPVPFHVAYSKNYQTIVSVLKGNNNRVEQEELLDYLKAVYQKNHIVISDLQLKVFWSHAHKLPQTPMKLETFHHQMRKLLAENAIHFLQYIDLAA